MSTDACLKRLARRDWLIYGPLNQFLDSYIGELEGLRYARGTVGAYLRCLAHFSYWMRRERLSARDIDGALVEHFIRHHLPVCRCPEPCRSVVSEMRAALHHLLALPFYADVIPATSPGPLADELHNFHEYLRDTCGLARSTCVYRVRHLEAFFASCTPDDLAGSINLTMPAVDSFLTSLARQHWKPSSLGVICTSLRSYLRFRALQGDDTRLAVSTLPVIANWPHRKPPKVLSDIQLEHFLQAFDVNIPSGMRDYAIARCILDLGLRGDEATRLTLDAIDWRRGIVTLRHTKSQRAQRMPLPEQAGAALAQYLRAGRPLTDSRFVFVRHRAPFGVPLSVAAIRNAMNRAFARCNLDDQFCNTHVLRRSTATRLQRANVSIKEIADLLRHRSLDTARVYARVDIERLREVALSWPGSTT
ncbi:integrase [Burkholderia sp. Nafp2/4-1b]|uniref:site-specific integrase n=1 Tax=Burkholderia sp. Nafp2/4-1b TaxID=2116686 RepID=UPI000EF96953|nr:site-specific integrase [Burkholderia sp. Nafp2/4-1b]RKT99318.1 integrase [Burkholderia sp. Nafp2/4-1b]